MAAEIKIGDKVRMNLNHSPDMIVVAIDEYGQGKAARCVWYKLNTGEFIKEEKIPLVALTLVSGQ